MGNRCSTSEQNVSSQTSSEKGLGDLQVGFSHFLLPLGRKVNHYKPQVFIFPKHTKQGYVFKLFLLLARKHELRLNRGCSVSPVFGSVPMFLTR